MNEEDKSEKRDDCSSSISDVKWGDSVELNSQSSRSQRSDSRCGDSVLSGSSNNSNRSFTKDTYTQLMASADKWTSEADVILDMRGLSSTENKVSVRPEVIAGIVFDSRPAVCDVNQLIQAQARNFEKAHKELASDLSKSSTMKPGRYNRLGGFLKRK